jgi:simple sugar transport system permease protein
VIVEAVLVGAVRGGTSMVFAATGETIAERAGVINLGTEGSMLAGALGAYAVGVETGNPWWGAAAGIVAGLVLSLVHGYLILVRQANQIATGLAVTFLGLGLTSLYGQSYVSQGVVAFDVWAVPGLADVPFVGPVLFTHDPLTYLSFGVPVAAWLLLYRTGLGLRIRAAGERPEVLETMGTSPTRVRWIALGLGGALAGLGGAQLATAFARTWSEDMVAGRGFIAVALVIFAGWNPLLTVLGAYLFAGADAFQLELQVRNSTISIFALSAIPYVTVLVVLAALSGRRRFAAPEALDDVFDAGART